MSEREEFFRRLRLQVDDQRIGGTVHTLRDVCLRVEGRVRARVHDGGVGFEVEPRAGDQKAGERGEQEDDRRCEAGDGVAVDPVEEGTNV